MKRKFGVWWTDEVAPAKKPAQAVKVVIRMPLYIANAERSVIEGIRELIRLQEEKYGS